MKKLSLFSKQQILQWLALVGILEFFIFIFPNFQVGILLLTALAFFIKFISKILRMSRGRYKTLNLDLWSICLSLSLLAIATGLKPRNVLILALTPILVLPQIIYIIFEKSH